MGLHTTDWEGECWPEQVPPAPKTPGPLTAEAQRLRRPRPATIVMHHHGDPTNTNVEFLLPNWVADAVHEHHTGPNGEGMVRVHIPFEAIRSLVLNYYRNRAIGALEDADDRELEELLLNDMMVEAEKLMPKPSTTPATTTPATTTTTDNSPETWR